MLSHRASWRRDPWGNSHSICTFEILSAPHSNDIAYHFKRTGKPTACEFRWHICLDALAKTASSLTSLCLTSSRSLEGSSEIIKFTFPRLRELTMSFTDIMSFTQFVDNHPRLVHLTAFLHDPLPPRLSCEPHPVLLPMLETFMGSVQLVTLVARGSRIFRATIMWDLELDACSSDYEHIFNTLSQSTVPITHLEFNMVGFGPQAFVAIARSLKALQQLKFRNTHYHNQSNSRLCGVSGITYFFGNGDTQILWHFLDDLYWNRINSSRDEVSRTDRHHRRPRSHRPRYFARTNRDAI